MGREISGADIDESARSWGMTLSPDERTTFAALMPALMESMASVDALPSGVPAPVEATRELEPSVAGRDDPLNAVVRWCRVTTGAQRGALSGLRLAVKDCIAVAGVPLTGGSALLGDFVPTVDATVVQRALGAGAEIVAITNMDELAMAATGDSSVYGPTLCPFDRARTAGGSSSGSAAALHYDGVDLALGTDTAGSVRIPAAWCGVLGFKPTHGLVPFTGVLVIDRLFDHVGAMAKSTVELARLLDVIAGVDGRDPMQRPDLTRLDFGAAVARAPASLDRRRIGVLGEGFAQALGTDERVAAAVRAAAAGLRAAGADVTDVSVPEHLTADPIVMSMLAEGFAATLAAGGNGHQLQGQYWPELATAVHDGLARRASGLSPQIKLALLAGTHLQRRMSGASYARAANARRTLTAAYDRALSELDALIMPTTPVLPLEVDDALALGDRVMRDFGPTANTSVMNVTGHPAMSLPMASVDGLPVGVMAVGRRGEDHRLLALARTIERAVGWVAM